MLWKSLLILYLTAAAIATAPSGAAQAGPPAAEVLAAPAVDDAASSARWALVAEVAKQAAEQPLHFAMSAGPIWLSRCLTAVPWYGWAAVPALAYREWRQWPSKRWWDPALDVGFLILGVVAATWSRRTVPGPLWFAVMPRRDWRTVLARLIAAMTRRPLPAEHASS